MIYLIQNDQEYDYDVRATALAFFERTKIVEVTKEEFEKQGWEKDDLLLTLVYTKNCIQGTLENKEGKIISEEIICDYSDHKNSRNAVCRFLYRLFEKFTGRSLPWGMLTGIRPTKIIMKWMEEEKDAKKLEQRFRETYLADAQKANLCRRVAQKEKVLLESRPFEKEYSLYIGIPFCPTTCLYCSFTSNQQGPEEIKKYLDEKEIKYKDLGCMEEESVDYPNIAKAVAKEVQNKKAEKGILICRSGLGMSICANKFKGIRCTPCHNEYTARYSRLHNDSNILAMGADDVSISEAICILRMWLATEFEGGRHEERLRIIEEIENENMK